MTRRHWIARPLLMLSVWAGAAFGQDTAAICDRGEGVFYGAPFTLEQVYLIPGNEPPAPPSGDGLFPDPGDTGAGPAFSCEGGGLVGAIDCVAAEIEGAGGAIDSAATSPDMPPDMPPVEAEALAATGTLAPDAETAQPAARLVRQLLVLKPVITPGAPGSVSYVPAGPGGIEAPDDLTAAEIAALSPMIAARNAEVLAYQGPLSLDAQDDLIRGMPMSVPLPPSGENVATAGDPAILAIGAECGALFRAMTETARLSQLRAEKVARIAQLKAMLKAERDKAGLLGLVWDSEAADRLERIIAFEEGNLAKINQRLAEHAATIEKRERRMAEDDRQRELDAIKADPERMAAETQRRRDAIIEAAREAARARWLMIEGEAAYARQLAAHDAMIKAARENGQDDLADKLEEDKSRLEAARDSWREHAQSMIDVRTREQGRLMAENAADGIGPTGDAASILLAEGKNPIEEIETGAREGAREAAERRALTDSATLGGTATETYDALDFGQDLYETNLEMQKNPALFYRRFGAYAGGVAEAAYDGVVDLAVIGVEAGDLAGEAFESGLSGVTGYEFNAFGHENLDTLVAAGGALSQVDALKIGELAGKVAEAADRRVSGMAASGEAGIRDALATTGYIAGSVLGAEELAMAGTLRAASAIRDAAKGAEALADAAKVADGLSDASKVADAAKIDVPLTPDLPTSPDLPATPVLPTTPDVPATPDPTTPDLAAPPKTDPPKTDSPTSTDPEDLIDTVKIDPPDPDTPPTPDPATPDPIDPDKTGPVDPPTPDPATPDPVDPDKTGPAPSPEPEAPPTPDPATPDLVDPDKTGPVDPPKSDTPDPAAEPKPVDRDAPTESDPLEADPSASPDPVDPDKTAPIDPPDPDAPPTPDPAADPTPDPAADPKPVDRDAPTESDPLEADPSASPDPVDPDKTAPIDPPVPDAPPTPDPAADPKPVDRDAATTPEPDPDLTTDLSTDASDLDETVDLPNSEPDPALKPTDPPQDPPFDPYGDTQPPLADDMAPVGPVADEVAPPSPVDEANRARGPPDAPRDVKPIDKTKLDGNVDETDGYPFGKPLYDPALIPEGGTFGGEVSFATNAGETRLIPGQTVTTPKGDVLELGPLIGTGATATVFASKTEPSKVIRLVEFSDPTAGALDAVGRKVGEAIQNKDGIGNFRLTDVADQFTVTDPATGNKWLVTVEENLAVTGQGITNAKKRFAKDGPNKKQELTMALAMREMNSKGVVWTDHKPANFDIVENKKAPTGYQMVIFDTGGIRPVTGAASESRGLTAAESRAMTALEVQLTFDSIPPGNSPQYQLFLGNYRNAKAHLDDRVFGVDEMQVTVTPGGLNRADGYLELSTMTDEALETYARTVLGPDFKLAPKP